MTPASESRSTIQSFLHRSFLRTLLFSHICFFIGILAVFGLYVRVQMEEAERQARLFFSQNEEYLLARALSADDAGIDFFLQSATDQASWTSYRYVRAKEQKLAPRKAFPLRLGDTHFGWIAADIDWGRMLDRRVLAFFVALLSAGIFATERLLRVTRQYIEKNIVTPLEKMAAIAASANKAESLEKLDSVHTKINEIADVRDHLIAASLEIRAKEEIRRQADIALSLSKLAAQVSHDIRSPLLALDAAVERLEQSPEDSRSLIKAAVQRIRDIAQSMLVSYRSSIPVATPVSRPASPVCVSWLVQSVVSEKRLNWTSKTKLNFAYSVLSETEKLFARVDAADLQRVVANLLENSCEALEGEGHIELRLARIGGSLELTVIDDGPGIPADTLALLNQPDGASLSTKETGFGLGTTFAREFCKKSGGSIRFSRHAAGGTEVQMTFPVTNAPRWYCRELVAVKRWPVVIVDDEEFWRKRWTSVFESELPVLAFATPDNFARWLASAGPDAAQATYVIDLDLGGALSGFDLLTSVPPQARRYLATAKFASEDVQDRAGKLDLQILPKMPLSELPQLTWLEPPSV